MDNAPHAGAPAADDALRAPPNPASSTAHFSAMHGAFAAPLAMALGCGIGYLAILAQVELHFAPLVLFPLLVGVMLGAAIVAAMRIGQAGHRQTMIAATLLAVAAAVVTQHVAVHRFAIAHFAQARAAHPEFAKLAMINDERFLPPSPGLFAFLHEQAARGRPLGHGLVLRGRWVWASWLVEGLLTAVAALAVVLLALRQPFCNRCTSWYRTIRSGKINAPTAQRAAACVACAVSPTAVALRYRLQNCRSGCGPARFELYWEEADGKSGACDVLLDAASLRRVMESLDTPATQNHGIESGNAHLR